MSNLSNLVDAWKNDVAKFDGKNTEKIAYDMTGRLAGSDYWDELYDGNQKVAEVFDIVADLELPPGHRSDTYDKEQESIEKVKQLVQQLETEVKNEPKKA
jgi:hypothetical protein